MTNFIPVRVAVLDLYNIEPNEACAASPFLTIQ